MSAIEEVTTSPEPNSAYAQRMISSAGASSSSRLACAASSDRSKRGAHRTTLPGDQAEERHRERPQAAAALPAPLGREQGLLGAVRAVGTTRWTCAVRRLVLRAAKLASSTGRMRLTSGSGRALGHASTASSARVTHWANRSPSVRWSR